MYIEHVAVWTQQIECMKNFYQKYFQGRANDLYKNPGKNFKSYFLTFTGGTRLEIMQKKEISNPPGDPAVQGIGLNHMAFKTGSRERVLELTGQLRADGFAIISEPRLTGDGYFESCVLDPDRNRIEIVA